MQPADVSPQQRYHEEAQFSPISAALHQSAVPETRPAHIAHQYQPPQERHGHGHRRFDDDKSSKPKNFFNFAKSSKSTDRLNIQPPADSPGESPYRIADELTSRQSPRLAGMQMESSCF
jgi:hypothetical protein